MSSTKTYEAIVIGCGGIGLASCYWLSRELGGRVLGLEQFSLGHDRGRPRITPESIRLAQHQELYAAIAPEAYRAWHAVEEESNLQLVYKNRRAGHRDSRGARPRESGFPHHRGIYGGV